MQYPAKTDGRKTNKRKTGNRPLAPVIYRLNRVTGHLNPYLLVVAIALVVLNYSGLLALIDANPSTMRRVAAPLSFLPHASIRGLSISANDDRRLPPEQH